MKAKPQPQYRCKIKSMNSTGDSVLATFDPEVKESVTVAQAELTAFLDKCVKEHGSAPPVWAKPYGGEEFNVFDVAMEGFAERMIGVEEIVVHQPLIGG